MQLNACQCWWTVLENTARWSRTVATLLGTLYKHIPTCMKTVLACIKCAWQMDIAQALSGYNTSLWYLPLIPHLHQVNIKCHSLDLKVYLASGLYISCSRHSSQTFMADKCCLSCRWLQYFSIILGLNPTPTLGKYKTPFIWLQNASGQQAVHTLFQALRLDLHGRWMLPGLYLATISPYYTCPESHPCTR
jgi:hypothetical protein